MHKLGICKLPNPYTTLKGDCCEIKIRKRYCQTGYFDTISTINMNLLLHLAILNSDQNFFIEEANLYLELVSAKSYPLKDKEKEMIDAGKIYVKIQEHETHDTNEFNKIMDKNRIHQNR